MESHLLQMRGLKPTVKLNNSIGRYGVASFTDAWIETYLKRLSRYLRSSHLLQMRGLKPFVQLVQRYLSESHLLQMRGLKHLIF